MVFFGQIVIGPPGSGKTTYCHGMQMFLESIDRRCEIINLDFANDHVPYECSIDVRDLVSLERVMDEFDLGPNGGLIYCMEYLLENYEWLEDRIRNLDSRYLIIDCPGQVELYTHYQCVQKILKQLQRRDSIDPSGAPGLDCRLCSVHLVDSYYCSVPATFISALLLVASTMMRLGLPHVNVLSKVDLLHNYGALPFNLDFYTDMANLMPLTRYIDAPPISVNEASAGDDGDGDNEDDGASALPSRFRCMTEGLCEVLDDFGLISFVAMNISDGETVDRVLKAVDRANGYSFAASEARDVVERAKKMGGGGGGEAGGVNQLFRVTAPDDSLEPTYLRTLEIQERYTRRDSVASSENEGGLSTSG